MRIAVVVSVASAWVLSACSALPPLSALPVPNVFSVPPSPWVGPPVAGTAQVVTPAQAPTTVGGAAPTVMQVELQIPAACVNCEASKPYHALALTRPAVANDFPVTYRVQIPSIDERIRLLPETLQQAGTGLQVPHVSGLLPMPGTAIVKVQRNTAPARSQGPADDMSYVH